MLEQGDGFTLPGLEGPDHNIGDITTFMFYSLAEGVPVAPEGRIKGELNFIN